MRKTLVAAFTMLLAAAVPAVAQNGDNDRKNEFGFTLGGEVIPSNSTLSAPVNFGSSIAFQLHYARRIVGGSHAALYFEVPASAAPSHSVGAVAGVTPVSLATFYVTPLFRVSFRPQARLSPWLSFGGGYGLYEGSEKLSDGAVNLDRFTNTVALQWGAGVDYKTRLKILFPISLRGEVRDFYTLDTLNFNNAVGNTSQHNVVIGGGFFWRF